MQANGRPAAFMSYVHLDDKYGHLSQIRERLADEVRIQSGEEFLIFQDRNDILWGQNWKRWVEESLDAVVFFIPVITPSFFRSKHCRDELEKFLLCEKRLNRRDLVLPIYYVSTPLLDDPEKRCNDVLAELITERQYADWRELRFESFDSPEAGRMFGHLAGQIVQAIYRTDPVPVKIAAARLDAGSDPPESEKAGPIAPANIADDPPVLVVDQMHRGDHATIEEALTAAHPGDRILIRPGLYEEGMIMDKPLEIVGDGDLCDIVIRSSGKPALSFKTTRGRVSNLNLQSLEKGDCACVDISQGLLELEDCTISSQDQVCVAIHGNADPRLRRNRIHESGLSSGILIYEDGQGTLEENEIFGNAQAGVEIRGKGRPTLRRNLISRNRWSGVRIRECGGGTFEENDLRGNIQGAWEISEECKPNLKLSGNLE